MLGKRCRVNWGTASLKIHLYSALVFSMDWSETRPRSFRQNGFPVEWREWRIKTAGTSPPHNSQYYFRFLQVNKKKKKKMVRKMRWRFETISKIRCYYYSALVYSAIQWRIKFKKWWSIWMNALQRAAYRFQDANALVYIHICICASD